MLVVELADVGPGFNWAEPCSRGCMQLLMKYGVHSVAALVEDVLRRHALMRLMWVLAKVPDGSRGPSKMW